MIKISDVETFGFRKAIYSMRNPYESHDKSDSGWVADCNCSCPYFATMECDSSLVDKDSSCPTKHYGIGKADMALTEKLIKAGPEHRKFLRMIHVQADVVAPRYWWAEADKYKWVEVNSSSTMHLITKRKLSFDDFSLTSKAFPLGQVIAELNELIDVYNDKDTTKETKDEFFMYIKELLPESYNTCTSFWRR